MDMADAFFCQQIGHRTGAAGFYLLAVNHRQVGADLAFLLRNTAGGDGQIGLAVNGLHPRHSISNGTRPKHTLRRHYATTGTTEQGAHSPSHSQPQIPLFHVLFLEDVVRGCRFHSKKRQKKPRTNNKIDPGLPFSIRRLRRSVPCPREQPFFFQTGLLTSGSSFLSRLPNFFPTGQWLECDGRPRSQRRARPGLSPGSLLSSVTSI